MGPLVDGIVKRMKDIILTCREFAPYLFYRPENSGFFRDWQFLSLFFAAVASAGCPIMSQISDRT